MLYCTLRNKEHVINPFTKNTTSWTTSSNNSHFSRAHLVAGLLCRQPAESIPSLSPGSQPLTSQLKVAHPPRLEGRLPDSWKDRSSFSPCCTVSGEISYLRAVQLGGLAIALGIELSSPA